MNPAFLQLDTAIITPRTVVRRFRETDGETFFMLFQQSQGRLSEYHLRNITGVRSVQEATLFVRKKLAHWLLQKEFAFGIWDKKSASLIGFIRIYNFDWALPSGYVEFFIAHHLQDKGIMPEALTAVLRFAFEQLQLKKLYYTTLMDDYEGQRIVRKCDFQREGDLRNAFRQMTGDYIDIMLLGISNLHQ